MAAGKQGVFKLSNREPAEEELMNLNIPQISVDEVTLEEMDNFKVGGPSCSSSPVSEEGSALECDIYLSSSRYARTEGTSSMKPENSAAFFLWPPAHRLQGSLNDRSKYFCGLQKLKSSDANERAPSGRQATTLYELMILRAYHSKQLHRVSMGTAVGFRIKQGVQTNIPAIIVFVARKVQKAWLKEDQKLPLHLEGPGGVWCDVDVVEFAYHCPTGNTIKEQVYTELVEGLRGNDPCIGPGSQVASQETYGTLGAIVQSRNGACQVGFLTNRHVAVDLDYPNQKMFHPLPPNCGPGVYLGAVERATSYITDERWYHIFASINPETFVRADGAFIPFADGFDLSKVTTTVKGVGDMGEARSIELLDSVDSIVGRQVVKVGRSTGLTKGRILAYALEYNDERSICYFTDLLVVGEHKQPFDLEGDSGSLILMTEEGGKLPRPVGMIWGGTVNRGRLKMQNGHGLENWTSAVGLGRLLDRLQLNLITSNKALKDAIIKQRRLAMGEATGGGCFSRSLTFPQPMEPNLHPVFKSSKMKVRKRMQNDDLDYMEELGRMEDRDWTLVNTRDFEGSEPIDFLTERSGADASERNKGQDIICKHMPPLKNVGNEDHLCGLHLYDADAKQRWL